MQAGGDGGVSMLQLREPTYGSREGRSHTHAL